MNLIKSCPIMFRRIFRLPEFPLIITPFILLAPAWLTGQVIFWGTPILQFVPWRVWAWEVLRTGHLPLWNPLLGMGTPLLANYQSGLFYPPNWLYFVLMAVGGVGLMAWGQAVLIALHLAWAGLGMARVAHALGLNKFAQTVSGLSFGLCGYLVTRAGFLSINTAVAWLPWVVYGVINLNQVLGEQAIKVARKQGSRGAGEKGVPEENGAVNKLSPVILLSLAVAMQLLSGHAQITWYTLLLAGMWAAFYALVNPRKHVTPHSTVYRERLDRIVQSTKKIIRAWGWLGLAVILGVALSAVQLLPTAEFLWQSQRTSAVEYEVAVNYSFWPWRALTLLAPNLFGSPVTGDYWGYGNYWEDAIYIGLLPLLLALGGVYRMIGKWKVDRTPQSQNGGENSNKYLSAITTGNPAHLTIFLVGLILLSFALALGNNISLFPWLYQHIPTFSMFQAPTRFTLIAEFALALLAGMGAQSWQRPSGRGLYWTRLGTAAAFAILVGAGLGWSLLKEVRLTFFPASALVGVWGIGAGALTLLAPLSLIQNKANRKWVMWEWVVVLFISSDLLVAGWGVNPVTAPEVYQADPSDVRYLKASVGDGRLYMPPETEDQLKYKEFFRFESFLPEKGEKDWFNLQAVQLPNLNLLDNIFSANNFDPLLVGRYQLWMKVLDEVDPEIKSRLLNLMSVEVVEREDESHTLGVRFDLIDSFPRVRWVRCGRSVSGGPQALEQVLQTDWNPVNEVFLETPGLSQNNGCSEKHNSLTRVLSENSNQLVVQVQSDAPGYLVISDVWYPGWVALIDQGKTPVLRANFLFRAVEIPAGEHIVNLVYKPIAFYTGVGISLITSLFILAYLLKAWELIPMHHITMKRHRG